MIDSRFATRTIALLLVATATNAQSRRTPTPLPSHTWVIDGVARTGLVSAPAKTQAAVPVVLVFHGHGGTAANMARAMPIHTHWPEALVIYLQGLPTQGTLVDPTGKRAGWQTTVGQLGDRDLELVDSVLAWAKREYRVDDRRIYAAGHSNGGWFTYLLWAARGNQFAAFAPASAVFTQLTRSTLPKPAIIIGGRKDALVRFALQQESMDAVIKLDRAEISGAPWEGKALLHKSAIADVVTYVHPGGHPPPPDAASLIVKFFQSH